MKSKMKPYQNKIQLLKDKSQKLETTLVNYMEHNGLNNKKITHSPSKFIAVAIWAIYFGPKGSKKTL